MKKSHLVWMLIGCLVPLAGFAAIVFFDVSISTVLWIGLILFCPVSHLLMMKFWPHSHGPEPTRNQMNVGGHDHG